MRQHLQTLLAGIALAMPFAAAARNFVVEDTEGNLHKFAFSSKLTWALSGHTLEINTGEDSSGARTFQIENVAKMLYDNETSVDEITAEATRNVTLSGNILTITGLKPNAQIAVTEVSGKSVILQANNDGTLTASLDQWPAGVYIVSSGKSLIFKFIQK